MDPNAHLSVDIDVDLFANCLPIGHLHIILAESLEVTTTSLVRHPTAFLAICKYVLLIGDELLMLLKSLITTFGAVHVVDVCL